MKTSETFQHVVFSLIAVSCAVVGIVLIDGQIGADNVRLYHGGSVSLLQCRLLHAAYQHNRQTIRFYPKVYQEVRP